MSCKNIILILHLLIPLIFISVQNLEAQNAKTELQQVFQNKNTSNEDFISTINKYVEIESNLIQNNEDLILAKLEQVNHYKSEVDIYNLLSNLSWYKNNTGKFLLYSGKADSVLKKNDVYDAGYATFFRLKGLFLNDKDRDTSKSLELLDSSLYYSKESGDKYFIAKSYYSLAFFYWDNRDFSKAIFNFKKSEDLYKEVNAPYQITRIYHYYAIQSNQIGELGLSLDYYFKIDSIYSRINDQKQAALNLVRIGSLYSEMNNFEEALSIYTKSLKLHKSLGLNSRIPYLYQKIGTVFQELENYTMAREYFEESIELLESSGNSVRLISAKINMIDIYIHEKKYQKATEIINTAIDLYIKLDFKPGLASMHEKYADLYYQKGEILNAINSIKKTIVLSQESNHKLNLTTAHKKLSSFYEEIGNPEQALKNYKLFKIYSDSLFNEATVLKVENLKTKFEIKQKEQEIEQLEAQSDITDQRFQLIFLLLILLLLFIVTLFIHRRSKDKSRHLRELKDASDRLQISNRFKSRLISNISHEIRTPLNVIIGFTSTINEHTDPENFKSSITEIQRSSENLTRMVDSMLEISLLESDRINIRKDHFKSIELKKVVEDIIKKEFWKKDKVLDYSIDCPKNFVIFSDKNRVEQILHHIIENSVKFTDEGKVDVIITNSNNTLEIMIQDTGIGIEKNKLDTIFNHFYKVEDSKRLYRGAGLGLSISFELTRLLNGRMEVNSEINKGTQFIVSIPLK